MTNSTYSPLDYCKKANTANNSSNDDGKNDESAAISTDEPAQEADQAQAPTKPLVEIYGSTVSGNRKIIASQQQLFNLLKAHNIPFAFNCIAADESAKKYMRRKSLGNLTIPQVYVGGEFRGTFEDAFEENEMGRFVQWLKLD
ncbi:hypothetical protein EV182_007459 [Spiromyces aspiralis]|uniref:Uncharacterized protein n=1 Tax=Spiromyces aspiralis TaxID=68401 RepID=A0ACC1H8C4_9FUNG|nr:hypothetical protein EV182_007459 [Spiromyces aspiralis]